MQNQLLKSFQKAEKNHLPIFQFNFSTLEQLKGLIKGAKQFSCPIILGTSEGESNFLGLDLAVKMRDIVRKELGRERVFLNLDHSKSYELTIEAIKSGYDMVHFDGGDIPFKKNIEITKKIVNFAKRKNVIVEGEVGFVSQSSKIYLGKPQLIFNDFTRPEDAKNFVYETGVSALAVSIGNIHGLYKESAQPKLDLKRLSMIKTKIGKKAFLTLHGGSGIPISELKRAIKEGIVKININTETRIAWRKALEKSLKENQDEITPYKLMDKVIEAVQKVVEKKLKPFYK